MKTWNLSTRESQPETIAKYKCTNRRQALRYFSLLKGLSTKILQNIYLVQVHKNLKDSEKKF
jgi:hypothetical protein